MDIDVIDANLLRGFRDRPDCLLWRIEMQTEHAAIERDLMARFEARGWATKPIGECVGFEMRPSLNAVPLQGRRKANECAAD